MADIKEPDSKKTMDVAKPGNITPDTSSRPVIVTHKPQIQDPMVKPDEPKPADDAASTPVTSTHNKVIKPLSEPETKDENTSEPEKADTETPSADEEAAKEAAVVDAVAEQADKGKKNDTQAKSDEEKKKQEALDKLVTEKKYFVPIGQVAKRRNKRAGITILALLLLLALGYLAVDAGLIETTITLPIDIIKT